VSTYKIIKSDPDAVCVEAAKHLIRLSQQCVDERGEFTLALAGGTTPKRFFQILAKPPYSTAIPWGKTRIFFGDERAVPPDHPDSNYGMANRYLLKHINIDPLRIHRIQSELDPQDAAKGYHITLAGFLPLNHDKKPVFDLVLLGLGDDGHVASLFPGSDILQEQEKHADAVWVESKKTWRISITLPVINSAHNIWLMVTGESKADIVDRVFNYPSEANPLPIEMLKADHGITWYLDEAAARWLK
jgi:6-phosphogluconolactonase